MAKGHRIIGYAALLSLMALFTACGGGGGGSSAGGEDNPPDPASGVTFTYTLDVGQIDTLPAGADRVKVVVDGEESIAEVSSRMVVYAESLTQASAQSSALTLTFSVDPGEHSYTVYALNGTTEIAKIGPVTFTKVEGIPPTIPMAFGFSSFTTSKTDVGTDAEDSLISFGTPDPDRIIQYGGAANDLLTISMDAENDWSEQYGGEGSDTMLAVTGTGNDYAYQDGGNGDETLQVSSGDGDDWIVQEGGDGNDTINSQLGGGNDHLSMNGGAGNDTIGANGGTGDDTVTIDGGSGTDTISYDVGPGTDTVLIDGEDGSDTLTVNKNGYPVIIKDGTGTIIYDGDTGGTTITVKNIETINVP
jgi:Ca2+-binding RTX toxin-like protein